MEFSQENVLKPMCDAARLLVKAPQLGFAFPAMSHKLYFVGLGQGVKIPVSKVVPH